MNNTLKNISKNFRFSWWCSLWSSGKCQGVNWQVVVTTSKEWLEVCLSEMIVNTHETAHHNPNGHNHYTGKWKQLITVNTRIEEKCTNINFKSKGGLKNFLCVLFTVILMRGTCGNDYSPHMLLELASSQTQCPGTFIDQTITGTVTLIRGKFNNRAKDQCKYCLLKINSIHIQATVMFHQKYVCYAQCLIYIKL